MALGQSTRYPTLDRQCESIRRIQPQTLLVATKNKAVHRRDMRCRTQRTKTRIQSHINKFSHHVPLHLHPLSIRPCLSPNDLDRISEWTKRNQVPVNPAKCHLLTVCTCFSNTYLLREHILQPVTRTRLRYHRLK
ncbi:unnamed protein product [Dicrocoelium dendriticum]|nr:unnamed protein product [Dicrocoelium dendriticum]